MKRQDDIIPLDADIIQCKAELKEFREKLSGKNTSTNSQNGNLKNLKIIEVAPLEKKTSSQKKETLGSAKIQEQQPKIIEASQRAIEKKIQKNLSRPEEVRNASNIPTFDLSKQILADRRGKVSSKRKRPTANLVKDVSQEKRGIESVVEKKITTDSEKTNSNIEQNSNQANVSSTPEIELDENLSILKQELNDAIAHNADMQEDDTELSPEKEDNLFMLSANEILEKSRITQEEADMLSQVPKELPLEEVLPATEPTPSNATYSLAEEIRQASERIDSRENDLTPKDSKANRFFYFSQEPDVVDKAIEEIVKTDINSMKQSLLNSGSRTVRYAV